MTHHQLTMQVSTTKLTRLADTAFKVYVDTASAGKAIGKLSNSEDSYTYYASENFKG